MLVTIKTLTNITFKVDLTPTDTVSLVAFNIISDGQLNSWALYNQLSPSVDSWQCFKFLDYFLNDSTVCNSFSKFDSSNRLL